MANGRGAWNNAGVGGTKRYKDATRPGPYYYLGTGKDIDKSDPNQYAVRGAVKAYQRALKRRLGLERGDIAIDGVFGQETSDYVWDFQLRHPEVGQPWGGIGPETSKALLIKDLTRVWKNDASEDLPLAVASGTIRHESLWDAGAVGFLDPLDVGLAQINAQAHPEWSVDERLMPVNSFKFVVAYYNKALVNFNGNLRDAIASYNLGGGGTNRWISQGRPEWYTPLGSTRARNVWEYIDSILEG